MTKAKKIKKIAVFTSGGDAPGMNAAIRAVVRTAITYGAEVYGVLRGYDGMIYNDFVRLESHDVSNILQRGGTILKSARSMEFKTKEGRKKAYENLQEHEIEALVAIGGDGTFTGAQIFASEYNIPIIGIPGTIDNDLYGSDATIGYDTAMNTVVEAIDRLKDTADSHNRLFFVEVMGRDAGFIALNTGIATGAEGILIPEVETTVNDLKITLKTNLKKGKTSGIIIVAEGDDSGGAYEIARKVKEIDNTYNTRVTVLGHVQRGGAPSLADRLLASRLGFHAVEALFLGKNNLMVGIQNNKAVYVPLEKAIKENSEINPELLRLARVLSI
ncbi:MAG: 6-phosphofructokinase [Bacteroidetes bacterium 4572_112]|nr:MAG: 6-phosphofructokinase [Bacteroidetes bacterium 4572_112]